MRMSKDKAASRPPIWRSRISGARFSARKIIVLSVDHQNKPDIGASKFREWADQNGLNMLLGGSNTGVSIAMAKVAAAKKVPFFAIGAGGASLTGADCTPYTIHYAYDTTALGQWHRQRNRQAGRQDLVFRDRRLRIRHAAARSRDAGCDRQRRQGNGRCTRAPRHDRLFVVPVAGTGFGRAGAGTCERRHRFLQLAQGCERIRHHQDHDACGSACLYQRHSQRRPCKPRRVCT